MSDGNYNVNEYGPGYNDSSIKVQANSLNYASGDSGIKLGAGAGITQVKTHRANFGKAWMTELDVVILCKLVFSSNFKLW